MQGAVSRRQSDGKTKNKRIRTFAGKTNNDKASWQCKDKKDKKKQQTKASKETVAGISF